VHGLEALVDHAPAHEASELARDHRLIGRLHGDVRVLPVAEDAESLELLALNVDVLPRVLATASDLLHGIHGAPHVHVGRVEAELLVDLMLDGQTVAVPARHVDCVVAEHGARLDHEVLEDLVECRAHVDVAVGVGRAVVQDPQGPLGGGLAEAPIDVHLVPAGEHVRLELGKVGLHRERGLRKVERVLVVHRGKKRNTDTRLGQGTHLFTASG
jgi:hypothetical protein